MLENAKGLIPWPWLAAVKPISPIFTGTKDYLSHTEEATFCRRVL